MNKKKKKRINKLQNLKKKISSCNGKFKNPNLINNQQIINTNSWFNIINYPQTNNLFINPKIEYENVEIVNNPKTGLNDTECWTEKIKIYFTNYQKQIMLKWMDAYIMMYNEVTNYFKKCRFNKEKAVFSIYDLKKLFAAKKDEIINLTTIEIVKNNKIKKITVDRHLLDYAINDSVNRYKSCISNLKNGNIRHFRLRYLKFSKNNKIIKMEKLAFKENGFYTSVLGDVKCSRPNFNYLKNVKVTATLQYLEDKDEFMLLIKHSFKQAINKKEEIIAFDPGVRTILTGYGTKSALEIGTTYQQIITKKLLRIDKVDKMKQFTKSKKNKIINKKYTKIKNMVTDMHWKSINYITEHYKGVIIGNFSTKKVNELDSLNKMTKRLGSLFSFYKFKQKLKYKCLFTGTKYKETDEAYTSACCSNCSNYKKDLGANKIYECHRCKQVLKRDINAPINILINSCC